MKRIVMAIGALCCAASALAGTPAVPACPAAAWLADHYGISFSGFTTPIPAATPPDLSGNAYVRVAIPQRVFVSDGFRHAAVIDRATKKAWILRTGGFVSVYEWYGPVDADTTALDDCLTRADTVPGPVEKSAPHS